MGADLLAFVPMYNCAPQIGRVIRSFAALDGDAIGEVLVLDNQSSDGGAEVARSELSRLSRIKTTLRVNPANLGFGGSHKAAFDYCLEHGYRRCLVLHGDDQARLEDFRDQLAAGPESHCFGSRFSLASSRYGYSLARTAGNVLFNGLASLTTRRVIPDLGGSGLNIYHLTPFVDRRSYHQFADDLTFHVWVLLHALRNGHPVRFVPIRWYEEGQLSNARVIRQSLTLTRLLMRFATDSAWLAGDG